MKEAEHWSRNSPKSWSIAKGSGYGTKLLRQKAEHDAREGSQKAHNADDLTNTYLEKHTQEEE